MAARRGRRWQRRSGRRTFAGRRALTLIELLVVLGLLVAMAALSLPLLHETVTRRRFERDVEEALGALRLARGHARLEARSVEVVLFEDDDGSRLEARLVELATLGDPDAGEAGPEQALDASWATTRLESRVTLDDEEVEDASPTGGAFEVDEPVRAQQSATGPDVASALETLLDAGDGARDGAAAPRRIALFAPDGSAPLARRLTLRGEGGRTAAIRINPWTGLASSEATRGASVAESGQPFTAGEAP